SRRRHTSWPRDWSSDVCSSDLVLPALRNATQAPPPSPVCQRSDDWPVRYTRPTSPSPKTPNCSGTSTKNRNRDSRSSAFPARAEIGRASVGKECTSRQEREQQN